MTNPADDTTQSFTIYLDAPAEKVWSALTSSEYSNQYGYGGDLEVDLRPGGVYRNLTNDAMRQMGMGEVAINATVVEAAAPNKLVLDWAAAWHDEPPSRLTWQIQQGPSGLTRVTLTHELADSPKTASEVAGGGDAEAGGGGWPWILSGLKTLLETGKPMATAGN